MQAKMAAIIYEGKAGGGDDLFSGMKFFIMQRVPMRQTYMEAVTVILTSARSPNHADFHAVA
jgi:hypothetical protein